LRLALVGFVACAGLAAAPAAMADGEYPQLLSEADHKRMDNFDEIRRSTLDFVRKHGAPADVKVVDAAMAGSARKLATEKITGDWRCRVIKLSKDEALPIVVYADFRCRIEDQDQGLWLDKLSGSQRTHGGFWDIGEARMAYVGALQLPDDPVEPAYGQADDRNQVGYLVPLSAKHMRLEMPTQNAEADLEVLEFRR
jgi:hypothetical protein